MSDLDHVLALMASNGDVPTITEGPPFEASCVRDGVTYVCSGLTPLAALCELAGRMGYDLE